MRLRRLGNTELLASELALGTVELGLDYGIAIDNQHLRPSELDAIRLLNEALDLGINLIDTARVYGNSEEIIGRALRHRRSEFILATKVRSPTLSDLQTPGLRNQLRDSVTKSLKLLETDYIDLLMLHSAPTQLIERSEDVSEILHALRREGKVRYLGASVYEEAGLVALRKGGFDCLQIAYNALDRAPETTMLSTAAEKGVGILARSVLLKGVLTPRYAKLHQELRELKEAAKSLDEIARAAEMALPELAIRYVLSSGVVALCGTARSEELRSAIKFANRGALDSGLIKEIRNITVVNQKLLNPTNWSSA